MTDFNTPPFRRFGKAAVAILAAFVAGAMIIVWWWNGIAVDLLSAPAIDFRQAIATEFVVAVLAGAVGLGIRLGVGSRPRGGVVS